MSLGLFDMFVTFSNRFNCHLSDNDCEEEKAMKQSSVLRAIDEIEVEASTNEKERKRDEAKEERKNIMHPFIEQHSHTQHDRYVNKTQHGYTQADTLMKEIQMKLIFLSHFGSMYIDMLISFWSQSFVFLLMLRHCGLRLMPFHRRERERTMSHSISNPSFQSIEDNIYVYRYQIHRSGSPLSMRP